MSEFIILIIIAAISLVSAAIKAGKKNMAKTSQPGPSNKPNYETDPWGDIIRKIETPEEEFQYESSDLLDNDEAMEAEMLRQQRIEEVRRRREKAESEMKRTSSSRKEVELKLPEDEPESFANSFNIRDAVIYSEILKPKF